MAMHRGPVQTPQFTLHMVINKHTHTHTQTEIKLRFLTLSLLSAATDKWRNVRIMWVLSGFSWQEQPPHLVRSARPSLAAPELDCPRNELPLLRGRPQTAKSASRSGS